jgi:hypothetical protein
MRKLMVSLAIDVKATGNCQLKRISTSAGLVFRICSLKQAETPVLPKT